MPESIAFTRRQFLYTGLAMVSTIGSAPSFLTSSSAALAAGVDPRLSSQPGVPEDRVLVVVQLSGGNDGLNTVVPFGVPAYYQSRPAIGVAENDVIPLDTTNGIGLHPALRPVHELIGEGLGTVVQGVGYPNPNRSHFASMDIWHTGDTLAGGRGGGGVSGGIPRGTGWVGRAMDADKKQTEGLGCICFGSESPLAAQGQHAKPVAFDRPEMFRWTGRDLHPALSEAYDTLQHAPTASSADDPASFIFRTAMDAQVASDRVRNAVAKRPETRFPGGDLGRQLAMVASMIKAGLPTRVYYVALGGFDTHANQAGQHQRLLSDFADSMKAFYAELAATGHRSRVVTMAFSEFGRRVRQNASGGTDHGAAGPLFLFGEGVKSGLLGQHPSLDQLDEGDLAHTTDFRCVYAELLDRWLKLDSRTVLGQRYPHLGTLRA